MLLAIILKCRPRMQQHICNTGHRNKIANRVNTLRHRGKGQLIQIMSHPVYRRISQPDTAARQADLPQHCSQNNPCPDRLLAIGLAGKRPAKRNHGRLAGHLAGKAGNLFSLNAANIGCPLRGFGNAICRTCQIGSKFVKAITMAGQKFGIMQAFIQQDIT